MLEDPTLVIDADPPSPTDSPTAFAVEGDLATDPGVEAAKRRGDVRFVEFYEVVKAYPNPYGDDFVVVDGFNFIMERGEVVSVIGHSGCGKSTVLTMMAGLNPITSGGIAVDGREIDGPGPDRAVVFQAPCLLPWMTAFQNVMLGVDRVYPDASKAERRQLAEYYLGVVGLADALHRYPRELSGGMQQRVGIARAIALKPKTLLLDEPFGRLDSLTRMGLQDVILEILDRERVTTILVTHDVDEAIYMADRVCMMTNGPRAKVGQVLSIPFERPRHRSEVLEHPDFYELRGCLLSFLEGQEKLKESDERTSIAGPAATTADVAMQETKADIRAVASRGETETVNALDVVDPLIRVVEVWRPTSDGNGLELVNGLYRDVPAFEEASAGITFDEGLGLPGAVWKAGRPVVFSELDTEGFVRSEAAVACGLTAGIGFPVYDDGPIGSIVLVLCAGDPKGAFESWLPDTERRELYLGDSHYANLDHLQMVSGYTRFPAGSGLPGKIWKTRRPMLEGDLRNSSAFIRSSAAGTVGLSSVLGIPILANRRELKSALLLLSSSERPLGRAQFVFDVDADGAWTLVSHVTESCPWIEAAIVEEDLETERGLPGRVAENRSAVLSTDLSTAWPELAEAASRDGAKWALGIPVVDEGRVAGVCILMD